MLYKFPPGSSINPLDRRSFREFRDMMRNTNLSLHFSRKQFVASYSKRTGTGIKNSRAAFDDFVGIDWIVVE